MANGILLYLDLEKINKGWNGWVLLKRCVYVYIVQFTNNLMFSDNP